MKKLETRRILFENESRIAALTSDVVWEDFGSAEAVDDLEGWRAATSIDDTTSSIHHGTAALNFNPGTYEYSSRYYPNASRVTIDRDGVVNISCDEIRLEWDDFLGSFKVEYATKCMDDESQPEIEDEKGGSLDEFLDSFSNGSPV